MDPLKDSKKRLEKHSASTKIWQYLPKGSRKRRQFAITEQYVRLTEFEYREFQVEKHYDLRLSGRAILLLEECLYRFLKEERRYYIVNDKNLLSMIRVFLKRLRYFIKKCHLFKFMGKYIKVIPGTTIVQVEERSITQITRGMREIRERGWHRSELIDEVIEKLDRLSKWHEKRKS